MRPWTKISIGASCVGIAIALHGWNLEAQISDGSFESGDYSGWTVDEAPGGQANHNCGVWGIVKAGQVVSTNDQVWDWADGGYVNVDTPALPATFTPSEGRFAAVQLQRCALTTRRMSQVVTLAAGAATLRWDMQYENHNGAFVEGTQDIQVTIRDASTGAVLPGGTIFRTTEGVDPALLDSLHPFSADVSAFAGQTVRIAFDLNAKIVQTPFKGIDAVLDNVRVHDSSGAVVPGDYDADGICDDIDNCRTVPNPTQVDFDGDSIGDLCDDCRLIDNADQADIDLDGIGDVCESDDFIDGDIYFLALGYPTGHYLHDEKLTRVIVRMDPFSGRRTIFHVFEIGVGALPCMTYDPIRKGLILKRSATATDFFRIDSQGTRETFPANWPHSVFLWTPTGDGRIYMVGLGEAPGRPFGYLDESGDGHDLLGLDGNLVRMNLLGSGLSGILYDLGTDSLFLAQSDSNARTVLHKLPLSPDGSRLRAPIESVTYDAFPGTTAESTVGMSAGPRGSIFTKIDVNASTTGVLMFTVDPVTFDFAPFATVTGITAASGVGSYNSASGRAIEATGVINTQFDTIRLRRFQRSAAPQAGDILVEYLSGFTPTGVDRLISIGDTINRSYRLALELDGLERGGDVHGIAGERVRLRGTAFLRASHAGVTAWSLGIRGEGGDVAFGFEPCDEACASSLVFFHGDDEVESNDPAAVNSGLVDSVSLRQGVALGSRRVKVLRFWVEVTVPQGASGDVVRLFFDDGLTRDGHPVLNSLVHAGRVVTADQGLFLGDFQFTVKDAKLLSLPASESFTLTDADPFRVFRVDPQSANALLLNLTDDDVGDANALYFSQGHSLIPGHFELAADERGRASQRLAVWTLRDEPVFVECRSTGFSGDPNAVRLSIDGKETAIAGVKGERGSGKTTVAVQGAGFADGTAFELVPQAGGPPIGAVETVISSAGRAECSFVLGESPGLHDLRVEASGGATDVLAGAFEVVERRVGPLIEARLTGTRTFRHERTSRVTLTYSNVGDEEATAPLFKIVAPPGTELRLESEPEFQSGELLVLGIHPDGVPGKLPPGGEGKVSIIFRLERCPPCAPGVPGCPTSCEDQFQLYVLKTHAGRIGWDQLDPPAGLDEAVWRSARPGLTSRLGPTWGSYGEMLAETATRLARRGVHASSVRELFRFAVRSALDRPSAAFTGRLTAAASGAPLAGAVVVALDGGVAVSSGVADSLGDFSIDWLENGKTYEAAIVDHEITQAPDGSSRFTMPASGDLHRFDIAATPHANGTQPGGANRDEGGLPSAPLFPPESAFELVTEQPLRVVNSWDPNDKNGSDDLGDPTPPDEELEYSIYFENEASKASAPAQEILVVDRLDPLKFDLSTFEVRDVRIGNLPYQFDAVSEQAYVQSSGYTSSPSSRRFIGSDTFTVRTLVDDQGVPQEFEQQIAVSWELDPSTGEATWRIRSDSPEALVGVLPVNDASGSGEGLVSFTVEPNESLEDGIVVENSGVITFDDNPPISTRTWFNVIQRNGSPLAPKYPRPSDGATDAPSDVALQWAASFAPEYDVFLWREGDAKPTSPVMVHGRSIKPAALEEGASYLWQVVARYSGGVSLDGPTWRFTVRVTPPSPPFVRSDSNADGSVDIADAIFVLMFLFRGGDPPECMASADSNADGDVDLRDAITTLFALFVTGAVIPPPFPDCGLAEGPNPGVESCSTFAACP